MLALLCFGVVLGVYRRYQAHRSLQQERLPRKELLETWPLVDVPTLRKGQQWLEWESRLEEIMQKDTLSREDSLFLQHVNESLNRELYSDENN
ncbi:hypothetical protein SAMN05421823_11574 [Catalinimonas alkaloidigena]|uniref:Uncharacterized protein n=1 Tax=Catalinimonas alkaloidigena TaxID=1075417 RepID=A0A1G9U4F1_9BACT|nr:hypothetical protein [Catalinimonas alkaloidigena]SDM54455.1 hypothetical protein SAMN05421823_11574 [Catalinimonas alkaloidigena]